MMDADPITTSNSTCLICRKIINAHTDIIDFASCNMGEHAYGLFTSIPTDSRSDTMPKYFISTFKSPHILVTALHV